MTDPTGALTDNDCALLNEYRAGQVTARALTGLSDGLAADLGSQLYDYEVEGLDAADAWGNLLARLRVDLAEALEARLDGAAADELAGPVRSPNGRAAVPPERTAEAPSDDGEPVSGIACTVEDDGIVYAEDGSPVS